MSQYCINCYNLQARLDALQKEIDKLKARLKALGVSESTGLLK